MRKFLITHRSDIITCLVFLVACALLSSLNLYPKGDPEPGVKSKARVLSVDNELVQTIGLVQMGTQSLQVQVLNGPFKGKKFPATNELRSQPELDKMFKPGDIALVSILHDSVPEVSVVNAQDHYRIGWTLLLFGLFAILIIVFAGFIGAKALISFVFSCVCVWKLLVPLCLKGVPPLLACIACVCILTAVIMYLVAGATRKGFASFSGAMLGVLTGCLLSIIFTKIFNINGTVMPYSLALLYSGHSDLNIQALFAGAIILASSGAVMDLGMDVAAGMEEIVRHKPDISRRELIESGLRIGRSVVGTMTTTLLLAYSGGYLTLMMTFTAQGTSPVDFINNPHVASEVVKTLVGSFALVLVAPFTALAGGFVFVKKKIVT